MIHKKTEKSVDKPVVRPFKKFIDDSINLLTAFGILNALVIFSSSIKYPDLSRFLGLMFLLASLVVFYELVIFAIDSKPYLPDKYTIFDFFIMVIVLSEFALCFYLIQFYSFEVAILIYFGLIFLYIFVLYKLTVRFATNKFKILQNRNPEFKTKRFTFWYFVALIVIAGLLLKFTLHILQPWPRNVIENIFKNSSISDSSITK